VASVLLLAIYLSGAFSKFSVQHDTLFSSRSGPVENREDMMRAAINMTIAKPIVGFGYGTFEKYNDDFFADYNAKRFSNGEGNHNAVLGVLAELGLLGGLPYVAIWFFFLFTSVKLARRPDVDAFRRHLGILGSQVLVGYVVTVQFFDPRFFGFLNCLVFFLAAVTYSQQTAVLSPVLQASSSPVVRGRRAWQLTPGSASSRSGARLGWTSRTPRKATAQPGALSRR
jgi:O-antigen ligase